MQCSVVKCSVGQFSAVKYVWDSEVEKRGGGGMGINLYMELSLNSLLSWKLLQDVKLCHDPFNRISEVSAG